MADQKQPFEKYSEVDDVRIIIVKDGKHYGIAPKQDLDRDEVKSIRIALLEVVMSYHTVVLPALEDINAETIK